MTQCSGTNRAQRLAAERIPASQSLRSIRVAVVDSEEEVHNLVRLAISGRARPRWEVAHYRTIPEAVAGLALVPPPRAVLLDTTVSGHCGIALALRLRPVIPKVPVILHTANRDPQTIVAAFGAGARGYLPKPATAGELLAALEHVLGGDVAFPAFAYRTLGVAVSHAAPLAPIGPVTLREAEVLTLARQGLLRKEIASDLKMKEGTVRAHITNACNKLGARGTAEAFGALLRRVLLSSPAGAHGCLGCSNIRSFPKA
jgi:DNA-binding NarL/FixJ family response regulator